MSFLDYDPKSLHIKLLFDFQNRLILFDDAKYFAVSGKVCNFVPII